MGIYGSPDIEKCKNVSSVPMTFCSKCGMQYSKKLKKCPQCGQKHARSFYNQWWFWVLVVVAIFAFYPKQNSTGVQQNNIQPTISKEEYIEKCVEIHYDDVARNPNNYMGEYAIFTGEVAQVQENGNSIVLRMNVTKNEYGAWEDTLWIEYKRKSENESRILEKDVVTVYGIMNGIKSYTGVLGNQISIPYLKAEYVEID